MKLTKWINVKDRLPAVCHRVLVFVKGVQSIVVCYRTDPPEVRCWTLVDCDEFEQDFHESQISHWAELPKPPEGA